MPAYHEYRISHEMDPSPCPMSFKLSVTVMRERYLMLLYPNCRATRNRSGAPCSVEISPPINIATR